MNSAVDSWASGFASSSFLSPSFLSVDSPNFVGAPNRPWLPVLNSGALKLKPPDGDDAEWPRVIEVHATRNVAPSTRPPPPAPRAFEPGGALHGLAYVFDAREEQSALSERLRLAVEDAFATAFSVRQALGVVVDVDREVKVGGAANILLALTGGLPTNIVFSYSKTVMQVGAHGRVFFVLQTSFSLLFFLVCFGFFGLLVSLRPVIFPRLLRDRAGKPRENHRKTRGNAPSSKRRGGGAQRRREAPVECPGSLARCSCCPARRGSCSSSCFFSVFACSVCCDLRALALLALLAALAPNALPVP